MIYAWIAGGTVAAMDSSLDGFSLEKVPESAQEFDVPSPAWLQIDNGGIVVVDPSPEKLEAAKWAKIRELSEACGKAIEAGVVSDALGSDHIYATTKEHQMNVHAQVTDAIEAGPGYVGHALCVPVGQESDWDAWQRRDHTGEQLKIVARAIRDHVRANLDQLDTLTAQVRVMSTETDTVADVEAVAWS